VKCHSEVIGHSPDDRQPPASARVRVCFRHLGEPTTTVTHLDAYERAAAHEGQGELTPRRDSMEQSVGRQLRDADQDVVPPLQVTRVSERIQREAACSGHGATRPREPSLPGKRHGEPPPRSDRYDPNRTTIREKQKDRPAASGPAPWSALAIRLTCKAP